MTEPESAYGETLWVEHVTARLWEALEGVVRTAGVDPASVPAPPVPAVYVYVGAIVVFDAVVLSAVQLWQLGHTVVLDNPSWLALPASVMLAVFVNRYVRDRYADAMSRCRIDRRANEPRVDFGRLAPVRFKRYLFVVTIMVYYVYLVASGRIPTIVQYEGAVGLFGWLVIAPFGYGPVLIETVALYVSLHLWLPRRFTASDVDIDFLDAENLGGMRPVGELLKHSYYLFTAVLVLFTLLLYAPFILEEYLYTPYQPPDQTVVVFLGLLWLAGVGSISHSLWELHRFMKRERQERLGRLEQSLHDTISTPYDIETAGLSGETYEEFHRTELLIRQVRETKEFPATISMWIQIVISCVLPLLIQAALRSLAKL